MMQYQEVMNTKEAAAYLRVGKQTLEGWRREGKGPPFLRLGRAVRYRKSDLEVWLESMKQGS